MLDENELIHKCKQGNENAQKFLYEHYYGLFFNICLRYTKSKMEAQDLVHEGFYKIFNNLNNFNGNGSFEGWMKRIVINSAIDFYNKKNRFRKLFNFIEDKNSEKVFAIHQDKNNLDNIEGQMEDKNELKNQPLTLEMLLNANLDKADILRILHEIHTKYTLVFNLFCIEGFNHKEISEQLGISEKTSRIRLMRARKFIQARLHKICIDKIGV